ncbi:MAG: zinc-ribbon domain-containing protein [Rhodospirillaceae bacterium]|jgi:predicted Zn finger-like uncharacterized protein|nr:zinc-ribbon domain-containing protein [Rhodospirillaceae bacterium]
MIIICPNCNTKFYISESVFGMNDRFVRCTRCSHKWNQISINSNIKTTQSKETQNIESKSINDTLTEADLGSNLISIENQNEKNIESKGEKDLRIENPQVMIPEPIFDLSSVKSISFQNNGVIGKCLLLLIFLIGCVISGFYFLQDRVIDYCPSMAKYYEELGFRNKIADDVGLIIQEYNFERLEKDDNVSLIVRGIIANTTNRLCKVPQLRLALYNDQVLLQEKSIDSPQTTLNAQETIEFNIILDQPNADANRFEVTLIGAKSPINISDLKSD